MKCREATYALFDNIVKQHTHFFDNVAKQHTHFFGMPHPFFETLAMSLRWDVKLLLNKSWPLLFYLWSSDGEPEGEGGFYVDDWMSFPVEPYLCVRGGQPFFLTLKGGVKHFFWLIQGGSSIFFTFLWSSTMMKPSFCCLVPYLLQFCS